MIFVIIWFHICHHLMSYLSWPIKQCRSLKDWRLQWARGLEPNAPRSDRIFADDTLMPNKYCPMPVLAPDKETTRLFKFKNCFCGRDTYLSTVVTTSRRPTDFLCRRTFWLRQNELVGPEWPFWCLDIDWIDVGNKFNMFQRQPGIGVDWKILQKCWKPDIFRNIYWDVVTIKQL